MTQELQRKPYLKIRREKSTTTKGHYVTNAELLPEIEACKQNGMTLSPKLAKYLRMIAERYSYSPSWANYSFREDMVAFATMNMCLNWYKFDPEKSKNAFSYYTTAAYRSFLHCLADEKKHRDGRDKLLIEAGANPSFSYQQNTSGTSSDESAFSSHD